MKKYIPILLCFVLVIQTGCVTLNNAQKGAGIGTLTGALAGALLSKDKFFGAALGGAGGLVAGYIVGNEMDKSDQLVLSRVAESTPSGRTVIWSNPDSGKTFQATPRPAHNSGGRITREVILRTDDGEPVRAKVVRDQAGNWTLL